MRQVLLFMMLIPLIGSAQTISLDSLVQAAKRNWPTFKKELSIQEQREVINSTLKKSYLPQVSVTGQATYQSEAISFPEITIPGGSPVFPVLPLDNYNFEANVNQTIWDGGLTKANREIQDAASEVELRNLDLEVYGLVGKVNQLYINYLFLVQNEKIIEISMTELDANLKQLQSGIDNGVLLQSDQDHLSAEKIRLQKQQLGIASSKLFVLKSLNIITGLSLTPQVEFAETNLEPKLDLVRPELSLLDAQINLNNSSISKFKAVPIPKFMAFGKVGYGRPGFDVLNTAMHGYYMVGAKFSWDIWGWNTLKNQKQQIEIKKTMIEENKEVVHKQIALQSTQYEEEMVQYKQQIDLSIEIERLSENVYRTAESKFINGAITSTEYLKLFNEWKRSQLVIEMDKLNLVKAKLNYQYAQGMER